MTLNCVVVDDSTIQRLSIVKLVENHQSLNLIAEYSSALETNDGLQKHQVDLIFLDIEMPGLTGFELLDILNNKPQIIFITGKTKYAFKAFNYDATDYLHKPITKERFNAAVEKALKQHKLKLGVYENDGEYFTIKSDHKKHQVFFKDIKWIEAHGDYVKIVTEENKFLVLSTMKSFEAELPGDKFLRTHKSYLVNLAKIDRFSSTKIEVGDFEIPLSRNKKKDLTEALKLLQN
ncbi:MAG: response regulator transcription factor [Flavobacteriaceae bacterium]|nr:response regulator transcription factor [Flavobacteriaceae bacterium]